MSGDTPSLFGPEPEWPGFRSLRAPVRNTDPDTSHAAAAVINEPGAKSVAMRVLRELRHRHLADFELAIVLDLKEGQVRKRRADLKALGLVRDSGRTVTNPSSKQQNTVWEGVR